MRRIFSAYEQNFLRRFGFDPDKMDVYGEMPVEYITARASFLGHDFLVNRRVLIPRVETEELVEMMLRDFQDAASVVGVDVGTGSGVIGVSLARRWEAMGKPYQLTLTDISDEALAVAGRNVSAFFPQKPKIGKITLQQSDLLQAVSVAQPLDFIVANLPYIPTRKLDSLDASVKEFEPKVALDGGETGLTLVSQLLDQAADFLKPHGSVYMELHETHIPQKFLEWESVYEMSFFHDSFGRPRFGVFTKRARL